MRAEHKGKDCETELYPTQSPVRAGRFRLIQSNNYAETFILFVFYRAQGERGDLSFQ